MVGMITSRQGVPVGPGLRTTGIEQYIVPHFVYVYVYVEYIYIIHFKCSINGLNI